MSYQRWEEEVKRELVSLGIASWDATNILIDHEEWFREQHEAGAFEGTTAAEWFTHYHVE